MREIRQLECNRSQIINFVLSKANIKPDRVLNIKLSSKGLKVEYLPPHKDIVKLKRK